MAAGRSLHRRILKRIAVLGVFLFALTGGLSYHFSRELDDELNRSMKSLSKAVSNAVAPAYMINNQDVIDLLAVQLKDNQGVDVLCVSNDGTNMLTQEKVPPDSLGAYQEREPIYYYPGDALPRQIGNVYFRRQFGFQQTVVLAMLGSVVMLFLGLWLILQRFLDREVVQPLEALAASIRGYAEQDFQDLTLPKSGTKSAEIAALRDTIVSVDTQLQASRERLREEIERRAEERFEQETRQSVIQSVFHDIKNYILKVDNPSKLIRRKLKGVEGLSTDQLAFIERQCDTIEGTAQRMREDVARFREPVPSQQLARQEAFDPVASLEPLARDYEALFEAQGIALALERVVPVGQLTVEADSHLLKNAIDNLLKNALEALSDPAQRPANPQVTLRVVPTAESVEIHVEDNGPGLPEEVARNFREERRSASTKGWGVGLASLHKNIRLSGGKVEYVPLSPSGSRFVFTLKGTLNG
jgi:signal transduction histidine kinase